MIKELNSKCGMMPAISSADKDHGVTNKSWVDNAKFRPAMKIRAKEHPCGIATKEEKATSPYYYKPVTQKIARKKDGTVKPRLVKKV